ncbi:MAG: DUF2079 domain-containing protein, partial [Candidatus Levybacteria bacterium]|nr:DUF2079 domain-containing protein [Candidatus Levybacteria bacterium]
SLVISIGGIFVYLLSEKIIVNKKISLILALSYLTNFWIHQQNLFDFHAVTLATGVLLAAFYFLIKKSYKLFLLSLFIALLTKENVFLVSAVFGIFIYGKQNKKLGIGLLIVSLLLFYIITAFAIPNARGTEHFALSYYLYLGDSFLDILKNLFVKPQLLFSHLLTTSTITYFHELLIPTGYIALLSPLYLIFALPDFAIYLLSSNENLRMHYYHYGALIVPFIYVSTIYGIKFIINKTKYRNTGNMIFYYLLTALLLTFYLYSPLPGMREADYRIFSSQNSDVLKKYLALIPPDASVSASNNIGAHLSQREKIYVMPYGINFAEYVVLHGASKSVVNSIDILQYDSYVSDPQLNFYIFKKKTSAPCSLCTP